MKKILIIGTRRSGSTFMGKLLSASANVFSYVEEPLNPVRGIKSLDHIWYPYLTDHSTDKELLSDLNKLMELKPVKFKNSIVNLKTKKSFLNVGRLDVFLEIFNNHSQEKLSKRILRLFLKNNHYISYIKARFSSKNHVVFKDVLMSLALKKLYVKQKDIYSIFIFRNPLGFYNSLKRLNWSISSDNFLKQVSLVNDYPFIGQLPNKSIIDDIINEWLIVNYIVLSELKNNKNIICVSHEKLSLDPYSQIKKIFERIEIKEKINKNNIISYTQGSHKTNKTKDVKRDSKKEINNWIGKIDEETIKYIDIRTRDLYNELNNYSI